MTKRHQQNRRKSYGRRQHELHERQEHRQVADHHPATWDEAGSPRQMDGFSFLDGQASRLRLGLGD